VSITLGKYWPTYPKLTHKIFWGKMSLGNCIRENLIWEKLLHVIFTLSSPAITSRPYTPPVLMKTNLIQVGTFNKKGISK